MCRVLIYLGQPLLLDDLLYKPDSSLVKQSYNPRQMSHMLNLAGFGMSVWEQGSHDPTLPFIYKTVKPPFYDANLKQLALKIKTNCLLAHIRGVPYHENELVVEQNIHPFIYTGFKLALAHNGNLINFAKMKYDLLEHIKPAIAAHIRGTTDSEWIYAVLISQFNSLAEEDDVDAVSKALLATLAILRKIREKHKIKFASPVNLFITNGKFLIATRFVFDFGWAAQEEYATDQRYNSLWYTYGERYSLHENEYKMVGDKKRNSIIIASEPLTTDTTTWIEAPEYSLITATFVNNAIKIKLHDIDV